MIKLILKKATIHLWVEKETRARQSLSIYTDLLKKLEHSGNSECGKIICTSEYGT